MMWAGLLSILTILFVAALVWQPKRGSKSLQSAVERMVAPAPISDPLDSEIEIIAQALRDREAAKRKAAAMDRLRELLEDK